MVEKISSLDFNEKVKETNGVVVVDFWAEWCMPCKMLAPILESVSDEVRDAKVCKVNIDENISLANEYGISSIPTLKIFKDGKEVETKVGFTTKEDLVETIKHFME